MDGLVYKRCGFGEELTREKIRARFIKALLLYEGMIHDCHVHTRYSGHSEDYTLRDLRDESMRKGIEISLREHAPLPREFFDVSRKNHCVQEERLKLANYGLHKLTLLPFFNEAACSGLSLGFEFDILPGFEKETERMIRNMGVLADFYGIDIDGINGSHHIYNGKYWDSSPQMLLDAMSRAGGCRGFIKSYFGQVRDGIRTGFYDTISHLEFICRFNAPGSELEQMFSKAEEIYLHELAKTLLCAKKNNVAIEYNTAGFDKPLGKPYLSEYALHFACAFGIPLTIGSDAHAARDVGRRFDAAVKQLKDIGIKELHYFKKRKRISYSI